MTETDYLRAISLRSVHLHACRHERGPASVHPEPVVETQGSIQSVGGLDSQQLAYLISLKYEFQNPDTDDAIASGDVTYVASYDVAEGTSLTDDQIQEFGNQGALFQVHPFLREHLATMCQRSGLAAYPLPILIHDPAEAAGPVAD